MGNLLTQFGVHWQLLIAQIVNVGLLVIVLRAFVWKPVLGALQARRDRIDASVRAAEGNVARAAQIDEEIAAKRAALHAEVEQTIARSRDLAEREAREIVAAAEVEATRIRSEVKLQLEQEREALLSQVRDRVVELTLVATRKLLAREVDPAAAERAVDETVAVLQHIPAQR